MVLSDLKWADLTWNWGVNGNHGGDQFGNSNLIQRVRLQCNRDLTLYGPGAYSCNGCQQPILVEPMFSRLLNWTLKDLEGRLDICYPMLSWATEDIRNFFDSEPIIGRVTLVETLRSTLDKLEYVKEDNCRLFTENRRVRDALENSIAKARKYEKFYNDLLELAQKHMECAVCLMNPWCLVLPCGHTLCSSCAKRLERENDKTKCGMCTRPDILYDRF